MNVVAASHHGNLLEAALGYVESGLSIIPVKGKQAAVSWSQFQLRRAPFSYVHNWHGAGLLGGIAVVCGQVSGNLAVIDLDGVEAVDRFEFCFPHLLDTFTVISGSGKGKHLYFFTDEVTPTTRTKGFELRSDGCYVVAPPSIHPVSGREYQANWTDVKHVPDLRAVVEWIKDMIQEKQPARESAVLPAIRKNGYGWVALSGECDKVARSTNHVNDELNRAAFKLGRLVERGILDYGQCESSLMIAARHLSARDGERATLRTIKSGLDAGIARERTGAMFKHGR